MAKRQDGSEQMKDFSNRYPGSREVGGTQAGWFEFEKIGDELVGEYRGMVPFRNGMKGTIRTPKGEDYVFSCATLLRDKLSDVKVGEHIAIILAGFQPSSQDSPIKVFQVFRT